MSGLRVWVLSRSCRGALIYLERVYKLHPSNHAVTADVDSILKTLSAKLKTETDSNNKTFLIQQLKDIGAYECIANNKNYTKLISQYK